MLGSASEMSTRTLPAPLGQTHLAAAFDSASAVTSTIPYSIFANTPTSASTTLTSPGPHTLTATYSGDTTYAAATSPSHNHQRPPPDRLRHHPLRTGHPLHRWRTRHPHLHRHSLHRHRKHHLLRRHHLPRPNHSDQRTRRLHHLQPQPRPPQSHRHLQRRQCRYPLRQPHPHHPDRP